MNLKDILEEVAAGKLSAEQALTAFNGEAEKNLGFARIDTDRKRRRGIPETIFCPGKTPGQVAEIVTTLKESRQNVFATRASREVYEAVAEKHPDAVYHAEARAITLNVAEPPAMCGRVAVVTAGTADIPVGEEAALTAERMGAQVTRIFDVGVAGLHRLIKHLGMLRSCRVIIVAAGMEGALPSVVGGLLDVPVIAVPTSVGYGMNLDGLVALLAMLNTCVPGITVVNVDNGFGAGVAAGLICRIAVKHAAADEEKTAK